ncbi:MAG TPA: hypothetical protein VGI75_08905 [Pirellulales bacterium]
MMPPFRPLRMRTILSIAITLFLIGLLVYRADFSHRPPLDRSLQTQWRRTTDGWEKTSALFGGVSSAANITEICSARPHPLVMSLLIALVSTLLLVAFSPESSPKPPKRRPSKPLAEIPLRSSAWVDEAHFQ